MDRIWNTNDIEHLLGHKLRSEGEIREERGETTMQILGSWLAVSLIFFLGYITGRAFERNAREEEDKQRLLDEYLKTKQMQNKKYEGMEVADLWDDFPEISKEEEQ